MFELLFGWHWCWRVSPVAFPLLHSPPFSFFLLFCNLPRPLQPAEELRLLALHLSIAEFGKIASIKQTAGFHKSLTTILKSFFFCTHAALSKKKKNKFIYLCVYYYFNFFAYLQFTIFFISHLSCICLKEKSKVCCQIIINWIITFKKIFTEVQIWHVCLTDRCKCSGVPLCLLIPDHVAWWTASAQSFKDLPPPPSVSHPISRLALFLPKRNLSPLHVPISFYSSAIAQGEEQTDRCLLLHHLQTSPPTH